MYRRRVPSSYSVVGTIVSNDDPCGVQVHGAVGSARPCGCVSDLRARTVIEGGLTARRSLKRIRMGDLRTESGDK